VTDICYPKSAKLLSVDDARQRIRQAISGIDDHQRIDLGQALGRILAKSVTSPIDIPPQRNAAMDGYAFSSADIAENTAFTLKMVGTSWAGKPFEGTADRKQCVRIFTGAVVPDFADSVIAQEQVYVVDHDITFPSDTRPGKNIRAAGSDVRKHETLLDAGKKLRPNDLGLLAAAGVDSIEVYRQLKIGFFSTGDELTPIGTPLQAGQIYDSNRYLLAGLLNDSAYAVTDLGVIQDDRLQLEETLADAAKNFDMLLSTGGASVGEADFVNQALEKYGEVNFWKLAVKPGKPLTFGKIGNCWFFGLPGNPVAVLVTFAQFVKPALDQLAGAPAHATIQLLARCESALRKSPGRQEYQRGILRQTSAGEFSVKAAGPQDSHQLKVASLANCFIVLDKDCAGVDEGQMVIVEPFDTRI